MNRFLLAALAALLIPLASAAQPFSPAQLDALFDTEPSVEVNLRGSLLRLAAAAAREDDPEAALMLDGLRSVTVRIYPTGGGLPRFVSSMNDLGREFETDGWMTMVRVRSLPGDENTDGDVWVYVRDEGDSFGGLAVMAIDEEDENAVFVLIDGTISPDDVARLSKKFGNINISSDGDEDYAEDDDE